LGNDRNNIISGESGKDGIFSKSPGVTLRDKVRSCEIRRALKVEPLLRIEGAQIYWFGHLPECPTKDWRGNFCWLNPRKSGSEVVQRPRWSDFISNLAGSRRGVEPAEPSEIAVGRETLQVLLGLLPSQPSLEEKRA